MIPVISTVLITLGLNEQSRRQISTNILAIILLQAQCAGFEYYRAFPQDAIENENYSKLTIPVLAVGDAFFHGNFN